MIHNDRTFQLVLIKEIKAMCNIRCVLIKQVVKNNQLKNLIINAYLYISISLLLMLSFFFNTCKYITTIEKWLSSQSVLENMTIWVAILK